MKALTPEEAVHRVRVALAEMGWGDARVWITDCPECPEGFTVSVRKGSVPAVVVYAAFSLSGMTLSCWACWLSTRDLPRIMRRPIRLACVAGTCAHPDGPARPPRELLVRGQ